MLELGKLKRDLEERYIEKGELRENILAQEMIEIDGNNQK